MLSIIHIRLGFNCQTESEPSRRTLWEQQFKFFSLSFWLLRKSIGQREEKKARGEEGQRGVEIKWFKVVFA